MKDLKGKEFGQLRVLKVAHKVKTKYHWECLCSCGTVKIVAGNHLKSGNVKSCGCLKRRQNIHSPLFVDISGKRFGKLLALRYAETNELRKTRFVCKCDCGKETIVNKGSLLSGKTKSCGCNRQRTGKDSPNAKLTDGIPTSYWKSLNRLTKTQVARRKVLVSAKYLYELIVKQDFKCSLSGETIFLNGKRGTASLDRIDSNLPYIEGNLQWLHKDVNRIKTNFPQERFLELCRKISNYERKNCQ